MPSGFHPAASRRSWISFCSSGVTFKAMCRNGDGASSGLNRSSSSLLANWKNASALPSPRAKNVWQYTRNAPNSSSASDHVATSGRPIRSS